MTARTIKLKPCNFLIIQLFLFFSGSCLCSYVQVHATEIKMADTKAWLKEEPNVRTWQDEAAQSFYVLCLFLEDFF